MKYALAVEVKLVEMPDDDPPEMRPGEDPMQSAVRVMTGAIGGIGQRFSLPMPPAGFDFRKQISVGVSSFAALAAIIGRFDELVTDIEHEKLQV